MKTPKPKSLKEEVTQIIDVIVDVARSHPQQKIEDFLEYHQGIRAIIQAIAKRDEECLGEEEPECARTPIELMNNDGKPYLSKNAARNRLRNEIKERLEESLK